jgi:hypothetical protein
MHRSVGLRGAFELTQSDLSLIGLLRLRNGGSKALFKILLSLFSNLIVAHITFPQPLQLVQNGTPKLA